MWHKRIPVTAPLYSWKLQVFVFSLMPEHRFPLFSFQFWYMMIEQKKTKNQFSSPQIRHVLSGKSRPRPHLAGFFPASCVCPFGPTLPTPWFRLPPHRSWLSGGRAAPPAQKIRWRRSKEQKEPLRAHRALSFPWVPLGSGPGASLGRWHLRLVWRKARRGRSAALLPSESPDARLSHGTNALRGLHLSCCPRLWSRRRCPGKGERLRPAWKEWLLIQGEAGKIMFLCLCGAMG